VGDEPPGAQAGARGPAGAGAHAAPISGGAVLPGAGAGSLCPEGMVDTGTFCIDATEVTNAAYAAFLARGPKVAQQPEVCRWNQSFSPVYGAPAGDQKPVIGVDWCDAYAYCAAAGKSLCGHIGGGSNPVSAFADATQSAWYAACTNGGATRYAYGDTFDESLCFHAGDDAALAPVASYPKCVGTKPPYDQIFDMSGNAWEWEDSCAGTTGGADLCRVRGGGTHSTSAPVDCAMDYLAKRDNTSRAVGIRCCAPRAPSR
jgi:formylglycine-generating enzyme required for sulfatase activity